MLGTRDIVWSLTRRLNNLNNTVVTTKGYLKMSNETYEDKWGGPIGSDCINLNSSLAEWLGTRMVHLAKYSNSYPHSFRSIEVYNEYLNMHGNALLDYSKDDSSFTTEGAIIAYKAKDAMHWVANNLETLWD
tara:strand:- start:230 stop:625 length:396 start_codon:yes stop_codon:yes gene_type:complete